MEMCAISTTLLCRMMSTVTSLAKATLSTWQTPLSQPCHLQLLQAHMPAPMLLGSSGWCKMYWPMPFCPLILSKTKS